MKTLALCVIFAGVCAAQSLLPSQIAVTAANTLDTASSWGGYELNPALGVGKFGLKQAAVKGVIVAGLMVAENRIVAKKPRLRKPFVVANWAISGVISGVAVSNLVRR